MVDSAGARRRQDVAGTTGEVDDVLALLPARLRRVVAHECAQAGAPLVAVAAGVVTRASDDAVLLVRQQRAGHAIGHWELPGGKFEPGERLGDAIVREIREETGLAVLAAGALLATIVHESARRTLVELIVAIDAWHGTLAPDDPERDILDARFWPRDAAIAQLERFPWRFASEPAIAVLRGDAKPGSVWHYRTLPGGDLLQLSSEPA